MTHLNRLMVALNYEWDFTNNRYESIRGWTENKKKSIEKQSMKGEMVDGVRRGEESGLLGTQVHEGSCCGNQLIKMIPMVNQMLSWLPGISCFHDVTKLSFNCSNTVVNSLNLIHLNHAHLLITHFLNPNLQCDWIIFFLNHQMNLD